MSPLNACSPRPSCISVASARSILTHVGLLLCPPLLAETGAARGHVQRADALLGDGAPASAAFFQDHLLDVSVQAHARDALDGTQRRDDRHRGLPPTASASPATRTILPLWTLVHATLVCIWTGRRVAKTHQAMYCLQLSEDGSGIAHSTIIAPDGSTVLSHAIPLYDSAASSPAVGDWTCAPYRGEPHPLLVMGVFGVQWAILGMLLAAAVSPVYMLVRCFFQAGVAGGKGGGDERKRAKMRGKSKKD